MIESLNPSLNSYQHVYFILHSICLNHTFNLTFVLFKTILLPFFHLHFNIIFNISRFISYFSPNSNPIFLLRFRLFSLFSSLPFVPILIKEYPLLSEYNVAHNIIQWYGLLYNIISTGK